MAVQKACRSFVQGLYSTVKSLHLPSMGTYGTRCFHTTQLLPAAVELLSRTENKPATPVLREVYGSMRQVKTSPPKLNLVARLIRGLKVNDALAQMQFSSKKAAKFVHMTLLNTQRQAAEIHDIDPSNLYVAESFVGKGTYLKRLRYHGKGMSAMMYKYYSHYFLKLREGPPPSHRKRTKKDHKSFKTKKIIQAGPRGIPNSL